MYKRKSNLNNPWKINKTQGKWLKSVRKTGIIYKTNKRSMIVHVRTNLLMGRMYLESKNAYIPFVDENKWRIILD